jgi:predicted acetyltransferase
MQLMLFPATASDKLALASLLQLYHYDLSEINGADLDAQGCFNHSRIDSFWGQADHQPFLIHVDSQLAGFALVDRQSRLHCPFDGHTVADLFVLRRFRRQGIGRAAATYIFDRLPGRWEVSSCAWNVPGHVFWRGVVDRYTGGRYAETWIQTTSWRGPVQSFVTPVAALSLQNMLH